MPPSLSLCSVVGAARDSPRAPKLISPLGGAACRSPRVSPPTRGQLIAKLASSHASPSGAVTTAVPVETAPLPMAGPVSAPALVSAPVEAALVCAAASNPVATTLMEQVVVEGVAAAPATEAAAAETVGDADHAS